MKTIWTLIFIALPLSSIAELTAMDIMKENNKQIKVSDESVSINMILTNKKGKTRERSITLTTKTNREGEQNSLIKFNAPQNVSGTGLLTIEHLNKEDDQWLYLPALKRSRRISSANQTDPFMGTDFTYEDLNTENINEYTYELLGEENIKGISTYKIKATSIDESHAKDSGYHHRILWVRKQDYIVTKINYFNKSRVLSKTLSADDIKEISNTGVSRAHTVIMKNLKTSHSTRLDYEDFSIDKGISQKQFSMRSLERSW